jgi:uncharacterized protein YjbI with pentapeptide repeats
MQEEYFTDKHFNKLVQLEKGEYDQCNFQNCDFSSYDFSSFSFNDCFFQGCNFSLATLTKTAFRDTHFKDCKMLGLRFDTCNEFGLSFSFDTCQLDHASFYKLKIKKTVFNNCQLVAVDFTETDLSNAVFSHCNLAQAMFERSLLEKVDFRTAYHYTIHPEHNRIKKAKFSAMGLSGLLEHYDIEIDT